jgi:ribosomal-protein-alanine N-acetyltransferase
VRHLVQEARLRWNLKQLVANVYAENIGSAKVLKRCGFLIEQTSGQEGTNLEYWFGLSI